MIILGSTIKITGTTTLYHDPLQTTAAYFIIRQIPSSTILPTQPTFMNNQSNDQSIVDGPGTHSLSKSVLEYIFLALVVFIITCIILRRYRIHRIQRQAALHPSASRRYYNFPRQVELRSLHSDGQPYPAYLPRDLPAAYTGLPPTPTTRSRRTRGTHARDIDSSGRRQEVIPTERDYDGEGADALPAYDNLGGPPKYFENQPPLSGISQGPDVRRGNIHNTSPENVGVRTAVGTTHAAQTSQPDTSPPIPPYLENSSSNYSVPLTQPRRETYRA